MLNLGLGAGLPPFQNGVIEKIALTFHTFTVLKMWWIIPIYAFNAGLLITLALRFDYERHTSSFETPCQFIYFAIPAPTSDGWYEKDYSDGIVIPSKTPVNFPKVYYTAVLVAWSIVQFTLIYLSAFTQWSLKGVYDFSAVAMILELPVMFVTLAGVALIRGEWEAMWTYQCVLAPWLWLVLQTHYILLGKCGLSKTQTHNRILALEGYNSIRVDELEGLNMRHTRLVWNTMS